MQPILILGALIESNRNAKSNLMQIASICRLVRFRSAIKAESHRLVKTSCATIRGQNPKRDRLIATPPSFCESAIAKRPACSIPPMLGKNINRHNLGNRLWVNIFVPRRYQVAKSHDIIVVLGNKNCTSRLRKPLTPEHRAAPDIQRIQDSIRNLTLVSSAPCLDVNMSNPWCIGGPCDSNYHVMSSAPN